MYEFHGWVNIVADDSDEPESSVLQARQNELVAALHGRAQALRSSPHVFVHIARDLNGEAHFLISGCRNHRDDRVLDLFRWIAEHQPCSYGLLHIRDDEDANGYDNAFVVHAIRRGELVSGLEPNLSACMPLLERPWPPASHQGLARDDITDEQLRRILAIGHDTSGRGDGISLRDALDRAWYRECRTGLQEADLLRVIRAEPELVDQWLAYSEDKRTEGGWYVLRSGEVGKVTTPSSRIQFATIEQAIAAYVIRELDFWAGVGMVVEGETYSFIKASDVIRDGVALECWRRYGEEDSALVAEAFWHDDTGKFTIRMPEGELPFVLVEAFVREAARWCPPSMRNEVGTRRLIYVPLTGEAVDVWRPVLAEVVGDRMFRIVGENPSPETENWAFATGETVRCEERRFMDGSVGLVPVERCG